MQNPLPQAVSAPNVGGHSGSRRRNQRNSTYINLRSDCLALEEAAKLVWCKVNIYLLPPILLIISLYNVINIMCLLGNGCYAFENTCFYTARAS